MFGGTLPPRFNFYSNVVLQTIPYLDFDLKGTCNVLIHGNVSIEDHMDFLIN